MDRIVELNGNHVSVYSYGQGPVTFVLLSGSGVPFPSLEYKSLAKALATFSQVIGIEKLGYGHSDLVKDNRGIDDAVKDYRGVLERLGIGTPVVLAAHSMGFLEALRWCQLYPAEIAGILGIDPATPECYKDFDIEGAVKKLIEMSDDEELRQNTAGALTDQLAGEHGFSSDEKKKLFTLAYRNIANPVWISEAENLRNSILLVEKNNPYPQIPMLFCLSNGEGTTLDQDIWRSHALQYLNNIHTNEYKFFDYPHNLYKYVYKEMAFAAEIWIKNAGVL